MEVPDVGCGVGSVSVLAARMVGEFGAVLGLIERLPQSKQRIVGPQLLGAWHVRFETAELDAFDSADKYDAVIGGLVLYQPDPSAILRHDNAAKCS
jgi:cyclopropane fatty-acyl-phospholipid synthase-like methyltransferase